MSGKYGSLSEYSEEEQQQEDRHAFSNSSRSSSSRSKKHYKSRRYESESEDADAYRDTSSAESELDTESDNDDFEMRHNMPNAYHLKGLNAGNLKTGRMRKKQVARGKGGEFYEKRRKRRVYVCTLANEINVSELKDHIQESRCDWKAQQSGDALILSKSITQHYGQGNYYIPRRTQNAVSSGNIELMLSERERSYISNKRTADGSRSKGQRRSRDRKRNQVDERVQDVSDPRHKEVVVFEFGSVVFWGFSVGEESVILQAIKDFATDGECLMASEFSASEDDMAFITHSHGMYAPKRENETPTKNVKAESENENDATEERRSTVEEVDLRNVIIANDVISFPEKTTKEHRLAVSYAIAQSSIVAILEERVIQKVAEYKFIPETLASIGKIELSSKNIGMMIGEIFVIRHDLNLHSDILDIPDFFWGEQDRYVDDYERVNRYLEMDSRVQVINTRLNMLKELLDVLNQQMENDHSTKLEWIIIWLIVIEVVIQLMSVGATIMSDFSLTI